MERSFWKTSPRPNRYKEGFYGFPSDRRPGRRFHGKQPGMYASPGVSLNSTSVPANIPGMSNAGKSGTTTSNVDIWFVGYTPYYTAGIWSGCDDNQKNLGHREQHFFLPQTDLEADHGPHAHEGLASTSLPVPELQIKTASVCRKSGMLPNAGVCEADPQEEAPFIPKYFAKGTVPTQVCDHHVAITVCGESGGLPTEFCSAGIQAQPDCTGNAGGENPAAPTTAGTQCPDRVQSIPSLLWCCPRKARPQPPDNETVPETTAPFIPSSPLDDIYIPVGPGYM